MDDWLTIALAIGLTARLTRLVSMDTITDPIRARLPGFLGALVQCAWCTGVWIGAAVGLSWAAWADQTWWQVTGLIGTAAWAAGAASAAAMPKPVEVLPVGPLAIVSADEPAPPDDEQVTINVSSGQLSNEQIAQMAQAAVARVLGQDERAGGSD